MNDFVIEPELDTRNLVDEFKGKSNEQVKAELGEIVLKSQLRMLNMILMWGRSCVQQITLMPGLYT